MCFSELFPDIIIRPTKSGKEFIPFDVSLIILCDVGLSVIVILNCVNYTKFKANCDAHNLTDICARERKQLFYDFSQRRPL